MTALVAPGSPSRWISLADIAAARGQALRAVHRALTRAPGRESARIVLRSKQYKDRSVFQQRYKRFVRHVRSIGSREVMFCRRLCHKTATDFEPCRRCKSLSLENSHVRPGLVDKQCWFALLGQTPDARNQLATLMANTQYIPKISGPLLMIGIKALASYSNHF